MAIYSSLLQFLIESCKINFGRDPISVLQVHLIIILQFVMIFIASTPKAVACHLLKNAAVSRVLSRDKTSLDRMNQLTLLICKVLIALITPILWTHLRLRGIFIVQIHQVT